jgi:hypothetical protein
MPLWVIPALLLAAAAIIIIPVWIIASFSWVGLMIRSYKAQKIADRAIQEMER